MRGGSIAALCLAVLAAPAAGQVQFSGSLDAVYQREVDRGPGELESRINSTFKGASPFSQVRVRLMADAEIAEHIAVFTTLLFDEGVQHWDLEGGYAVFSRVRGRPWLNALVGKMPSPFGTFAARSFALVNPLVGAPLIHHYFSTVRAVSVPANNADQLARKGADIYGGRGLPILYDACWNTGAQLFGTTSYLTYALAVVRGALSNPAAADNEGVQWVGRLGAQPTMGLKVGLSFAYGPYLSAAAAQSPAFPRGRAVEDYAQRVLGADLEYALGHFALVAEVVRNEWEVPNLTVDGLANSGGYIELKFEPGPGLYGALRYGRIAYDEIDDGQGGREPWDSGVQRLEMGAGYYLSRHARLKGVVQLNFVDAPASAERDEYLLGVQLATAF